MNWSHEKKSHILSRKPSRALEERELRDKFFKSIIKEKSLYAMTSRSKNYENKIFTMFNFLAVVVFGFGAAAHSTRSMRRNKQKIFQLLSSRKKIYEKIFFALYEVYIRRQEERSFRSVCATSTTQESLSILSIFSRDPWRHRVHMCLRSQYSRTLSREPSQNSLA